MDDIGKEVTSAVNRVWRGLAGILWSSFDGCSRYLPSRSDAAFNRQFQSLALG